MKPHEANRAVWDASTRWWNEREDKRGLWRKAHVDPASVLAPAEMPFLKDVDAGCRIVKVDEHGEKIEDEFWLKANLDKFPAYLLFVGRKG